MPGNVLSLGGVDARASLELGDDRLDEDCGACGINGIIRPDQKWWRRVSAKAHQDGQKAGELTTIASLKGTDGDFFLIERLKLGGLGLS